MEDLRTFACKKGIWWEDICGTMFGGYLLKHIGGIFAGSSTGGRILSWRIGVSRHLDSDWDSGGYLLVSADGITADGRQSDFTRFWHFLRCMASIFPGWAKLSLGVAQLRWGALREKKEIA